MRYFCLAISSATSYDACVRVRAVFSWWILPARSSLWRFKHSSWRGSIWSFAAWFGMLCLHKPYQRRIRFRRLRDEINVAQNTLRLLNAIADYGCKPIFQILFRILGFLVHIKNRYDSLYTTEMILSKCWLQLYNNNLLVGCLRQPTSILKKSLRFWINPLWFKQILFDVLESFISKCRMNFEGFTNSSLIAT